MISLPPSRSFLPSDFDSTQPSQVLSLYESLKIRIIESSSQLRQWIIDWSELESALRDTSARLYIAMTCNTQDTEAANAFESFTTQIEPIASEQSDQLKRKLALHQAKSNLQGEFGNWFRDVDTAIKLFRPENIPLETQIALEIQAYQKITGAMSVDFDGSEKTLPQMGIYQQSADRRIRENAWRKVAERRLQDRDALDQAFDRLFSLRMQVAANSGFSNRYIDYIFKAKARFDYTPSDCQAFHSAIEKHAVPRIKQIMAHRAKLLGITKVRPWDLDCDPMGRPPLKPFTKGTELLRIAQKIFDGVFPQFGQWFSTMRQLELIDVDSRLGKAPGGYQISLDEQRVPYVFMNAAGTDGDIYTLLHEAGHSFHQFAMAEQPIIAFRDTPAEFAEVASMSMELIASEDLSPFYTPIEAARSRLSQLEDVIVLLPWIAMIDAFQHELYTMPNHTAQDRTRIWNALQDRFDIGVDWSGLELERSASWQRQLHLFEIPFYYIEYGIAQLGALQLWQNYRKDPESTRTAMLNAYRLGNSRPLPILFKTAGLKFDFSEQTLVPLLEALDTEIVNAQKLQV